MVNQMLFKNFLSILQMSPKCPNDKDIISKRYYLYYILKMRNILNIFKKILYINFFCILRNYVIPIEKEAIYRIFGKLVNIFLMLIEM